jgi:DNA polymerase-3 subunit delta
VFEKIIALLRQKEPQVQVVRLNGVDHPFERVREDVLTPSLFGGVTAVVYDEADKLKNFEPRLAPNIHLLMGSVNFKPFAELYLKGKKEIVALDMSDEKPWDREKRLQMSLIAHGLPSDVVSYLLQQVGPDAALLDQEVAKLRCFVGERKVELSDAKAVLCGRDQTTGWQLAEKVVWDKAVSLGDKMLDLNFVFPFIGQLKYHLQLGFRLAEVTEQQIPDVQRHFPSLRPAQLEKFSQIVKMRKTPFFARGLKALYDFELASKSTPLDARLLFDFFQAKLYEKADSTS